MNIKSTKYAVIAAITFIILFLFNYLGNTQPDKLERALMAAVAGVIGLTIGMWFVYINSKDDTHHDCDEEIKDNKQTAKEVCFLFISRLLFFLS